MTTFPDEPHELDAVPFDYADRVIHVGPLLPATRQRVDRLLRVFLTLSDEEQELVTQEVEIDCR